MKLRKTRHADTTELQLTLVSLFKCWLGSSQLSDIDCAAMMALSDCATKRDHSGNSAIKLHDERVNVFSGYVCVCVCVWLASCSPYVRDSSLLRWTGEETVSSRAFQGDISTGGRMGKREGEYQGISSCNFLWMSTRCTFLFVSASLIVFQHLVPLSPSFGLFHDSFCMCGFRQSAPGSWCDEVMRRDVVIQQFQPKGHICSLSFALYMSASLFLYSYLSVYLLYWVCALP